MTRQKKTIENTVADPTIEFAKLEIDGVEYSLVYDFNAIAQAEQVAECNLLQGIAGVLLNTMTAMQVRGLLYAAVGKAHPKTTLAQAGALVRIDTLPDIRSALLRAYDASLPEGKKILRPTGGEAGSPPEN